MRTLRVWIAIFALVLAAPVAFAQTQDQAKPREGCCASMNHAGHQTEPGAKAKEGCCQAGEHADHKDGMACGKDGGCADAACCKDGACDHDGCCGAKTDDGDAKKADKAGCCVKAPKQ